MESSAFHQVEENAGFSDFPVQTHVFPVGKGGLGGQEKGGESQFVGRGVGALGAAPPMQESLEFLRESYGFLQVDQSTQELGGLVQGTILPWKFSAA